MITVYNCVATQHDLRFVLLAAAVCLLSSATATGLLDRVQKASGLRRGAWLTVTATVIGIGVWATHFIAILGFQSTLATSYDPLGTTASLVVAILLLGIAIFIALQKSIRHAPAIGGVLVGMAIGAMHYLDMGSVLVQGHKFWDFAFVSASLVGGMALGALSFSVAMRGKRLEQKAGGAVLLVLAIVSLHFTGMSALSILPDPTVVLPALALDDNLLASLVAGAAIALLMASITALLVGHHQRRSEEQRRRELADAAIEGLAICEGGRIVTANASLSRMAGVPASHLVGKPIGDVIDHQGGELTAGSRLEARILPAAGDAIPVEILVHELAFEGKQHLAVAIRDLRERVAAEARIRFLAHHDDLTGLPNRLSFTEQLKREIQHHRRKQDGFAVISFDLDRFKQVNDLLGHAAGDHVLKTVAERVRSVIRQDDIFARFGGDEFAIICPEVDDPADVARLCERMLACAAPEIPIEGQSAAIGLSIGIAALSR
jgi:diguanylate cyclase (GGDEF)-like protein